MPNEKTDPLGFATENADQQRDMAAKGGPTTTLGKADSNHSIATPATSDTQTEIAAESEDKKQDTKESMDTDAEGIYPDKN